jgi:hypothetical protein
MMKNAIVERLEAKTPEQRFMRILEQDFDMAPKIAQVILHEAQANLLGSRPGDRLRPGQVRIILTRQNAGHGQALRQIQTTEVTWTIDAGVEDQQIVREHGARALRHVRIQRLLLEALEQDAVATQEDLARVLHVSLRTIKRDCAALQAQGIYLPTRGNLRGIGRGQTHKAHIIRRWLQGETYDQIALHTHHHPVSIQRYIQTFLRLVQLHQEGFTPPQIGLLLQISVPLVQEYLAVYDQHASPDCRERLQDHLQRLGQRSVAKRGA